MAIKQTAGRDALGEFAPQFAQLNDDILFGEVWSRERELPARDRSLVTVTALMAQGLIDSSFQYHLMSARQNGITRSEIAEILTHAAFYAGWPKAWAAFRMAKEIWTEGSGNTDEKQAHANAAVFPIGSPNGGFAQYFTGQSYLAPLSTNQVGIFHVTFEPGCRNVDDVAGMPEQLAHPPRQIRRRSDFALHRRAGLLSGMGAARPGTASRRRRQHSGRRQALAWRGSGQLVLSSGGGGPR